MGWFDDHPILEGIGESALNIVGAIPAYGNVLSGIELGYHALADDTSTPEARAQHDANMTMGWAGVIPYLGEMAHGASAVNNLFQTGQRIAGASAEEAPMTNDWLAHKMFPNGADENDMPIPAGGGH